MTLPPNPIFTVAVYQPSFHWQPESPLPCTVTQSWVQGLGHWGPLFSQHVGPPPRQPGLMPGGEVGTPRSPQGNRHLPEVAGQPGTRCPKHRLRAKPAGQVRTSFSVLCGGLLPRATPSLSPKSCHCRWPTTEPGCLWALPSTGTGVPRGAGTARNGQKSQLSGFGPSRFGASSNPSADAL